MQAKVRYFDWTCREEDDKDVALYTRKLITGQIEISLSLLLPFLLIFYYVINGNT